MAGKLGNRAPFISMPQAKRKMNLANGMAALHPDVIRKIRAMSATEAKRLIETARAAQRAKSRPRKQAPLRELM